jgi:phage shock protein C
MILGVCKGLAEHLGFSVFWMRAIAVVILICTGLWPITGLYLLAALVMKPEPVLPFTSAGEEEFYGSFTRSRQMALGRLNRTFERLNRRIERMESIVTARDYDWGQRLGG